jgi:PAS domain S-box-containing protein
MLSQEVDFHQIFRISETAMALLTADFAIVDANDEFLSASGRRLEELVGHNIFELFPKMPADPGGDPKWTVLEAALTSGQREVFELARYDIEDPDRPGVFHERYWTAVVTPLRGASGEIEMLELSGREVTAIIDKFRALQAEEDEPAAS